MDDFFAHAIFRASFICNGWSAMEMKTRSLDTAKPITGTLPSHVLACPLAPRRLRWERCAASYALHGANTDDAPTTHDGFPPSDQPLGERESRTRPAACTKRTQRLSDQLAELASVQWKWLLQFDTGRLLPLRRRVRKSQAA